MPAHLGVTEWPRVPFIGNRVLMETFTLDRLGVTVSPRMRGGRPLGFSGQSGQVMVRCVARGAGGDCRAFWVCGRRGRMRSGGAAHRTRLTAFV